MRVFPRRAAWYAALACWIIVVFFVIAGMVNGSGFTSNINRLFDVALALAAVLTVVAAVSHNLAPLAAGHGTGVRAAMRAGRDGEQKPPGRHRNDNVVSLHGRRLTEGPEMNTPDIHRSCHDGT